MNFMKLSRLKKQKGIVTLSISTGILIAATMMTMYSSNSAKLEQRIYNNDYRDKQSFEAAEAGLEYGLKYLGTNKDAILQLDQNGYLSTANNTLTNSQANGTSYTVTFSNPTPNDTTLIKITAHGIGKDGSSTQNISQLFKYKKAMVVANAPEVSLITKYDVDAGGTSTITNLENNVAVWSGDATVVSENTTITTTETNNNGTGIRENDINLSNINNDTIFENYFGANMNDLKTMVSNYFTVATNVSEVMNKEGEYIWFDGELKINSNMVIGSPTNPVILIVDGNLRINGNSTFYGFLLVTGDLDKGTGNAEINGAVMVLGRTILRGTIDINYSSSILNGASNNLGMYIKVPGSWKDI